MTAVRVRYLWISRRRGKPVAYYRRGNLAQRITDAAGNNLLPGQPGFLTAYDALHGAAGPGERRKLGAPSGSLMALIDAYRASPEWATLAPATRKDYDKVLTPLRSHKHAGRSVASLPRAFVFALRDEYATVLDKDADGKNILRPTPRRANRMVDVLRLLLKWGVDRGWRKDNPAIAPGRLRAGDGYRQWTAQDVAAFLAHPEIGEPLKRAAALGYYTGQRKQDCLAMTKAARTFDQAEHVWTIEVVPAKTKRSTRARLSVPEHPALTVILSAAPADDAVTLLTRADGKPWREDHFNHAFAAAVKVVGLPAGSSFHGLRKALAGDLAEAGATDAEIDAVAYHADPGMTRHYRAQASQRRLARSAIGKLKEAKG